MLAKIVETIAHELYIRALKVLPPDVKKALERAFNIETSPRGKENLRTILRNIEVAEETNNFLCQDTGTPIYYVRLGTRTPIDGYTIQQAIKEGCKQATLNYPLRPNMVHPITRVNTLTNLGNRAPVIYWEFLSEKDYIEIMMVPKGSGSENMSFLTMLVPAEGLKGIKSFIIHKAVEAGANPCPPVIAGIGIGGTADICTKMAKEAATMRPIGSHNPDPKIASLEDELREAINKTGIGPFGLGGDTTALAVHIEVGHTHITQMPVAYNSQCWCARRAGARINSDGSHEYIWTFGEQ